MKIQPNYIGYHKSIENLNPIFFFTFDKTETILSNERVVQAMFLSKSENDVWFLEVHNSGFIENMVDDVVHSESLVDSETSSYNNNSFYAKQNIYENLVIHIKSAEEIKKQKEKQEEEYQKNKNDPNYKYIDYDFMQQVVYGIDTRDIETINIPKNNLSATGELDVDGLIDKDNYSFTIQLKAIPQKVKTHNLPYLINAESISSTMGMGFDSKVKFYDYIDFECSIGFGLSSVYDNSREEFKDINGRFGISSYANIEYNSVDNTEQIGIRNYTHFFKVYNEKNYYDLNDTLYFQFGNISLNFPFDENEGYFTIRTYDVDIKDDYEEWYDEFVGEKNEKKRQELLEELTEYHRYYGFEIIKKEIESIPDPLFPLLRREGIFINLETNKVGDESTIEEVKVLNLNEVNIRFNEDITLFFNVYKTHMTLFVNGVYCGVMPKGNWTSEMKLGQQCKKILSHYDEKNYINFYKISYPTYEVMFDNIALFKERHKKWFIAYLYSISKKLERKLSFYGFNDVVNFHNYHEKDRFSNREMVTSLFGKDIIRVVHCDEHRYEHPKRVKDTTDKVFRSYITCHQGVGLESHQFWDRDDREKKSYPKPIINYKESGAILFYFRTLSENVMLFHNGADYIDNTTTSLVIEDGYLWFYSNKTRYAVKDPKKVEERFRWQILNYENLNDGEWHRIALDYRIDGFLQIYVDDELSETMYNGNNWLPIKGTTKFGFSLPGHQNFEIDYTFISLSRNYVKLAMLQNMTRMLVSYETNGIITLNNIPIGTDIFICDRETGELIEHIIVNNADGKFNYKTNEAKTISIIAKNPNGESFILDPIELR